MLPLPLLLLLPPLPPPLLLLLPPLLLPLLPLLLLLPVTTNEDANCSFHGSGDLGKLIFLSCGSMKEAPVANVMAGLCRVALYLHK